MARDPAARLETAVVIVVDAPALEHVYRDSYPEFADVGIPLHVTLLYPFAPPSELAPALPLLREVAARHERFEFSLTRLETFPRAVWLAPEPARPFRLLTEAIQEAFPPFPHWEGRFAEVIPHVTLADGVEEADLEVTLARLHARVEPLLPVQVAAEEATVLAEEAGGRWIVAARLPLGLATRIS